MAERLNLHQDQFPDSFLVRRNRKTQLHHTVWDFRCARLQLDAAKTTQLGPQSVDWFGAGWQ